MRDWKAAFIVVFGCTCLALVLATVVAPLALTAEDHRWLWFSGLLVASLCMSTLFTLFLRSADRAYIRDYQRGGR